MLFGTNLGGGNLPHESRMEALEGRLEKSRLAKRYGFHSLWSGAGYLNNDFHPMLLLSRVAAEAPGLELGMVALLPLYHPVEATEQIATLDVISSGNSVLAPALGWRDFQFNAFGIPKSDRLSRFREVSEVMKQIWTESRVTHHGQHSPDRRRARRRSPAAEALPKDVPGGQPGPGRGSGGQAGRWLAD